ncbi:hypothetical protein LMG27952_00906 [Paraburkholderia hiiakae]|uniref:DUF3325 domain-containing protein n=1 Tax=Paraburkholderia hiiakae TaxID=1081782 RepID=A0ABM8NCX2_9BURK|nr:DUF3325 domain-containing protein [Paraburkholderia hiiakae]CAD6517830.1 hypothetical protein LMG27952_00906 [Paraburkholderia hiiakae]
MMLVFALMLCVPAFACLAMAMERHQETLFGALLSAAASRVLRCAGWSALFVALWLAVAGKGWALGLVWYSGCTSLGAGIVYGLLIVFAKRMSAR